MSPITISAETDSAGPIRAGTATNVGFAVEWDAKAETGAICAGDQGAAALNRRNQRGMVSAEWAVGIIAAVAIAGVLLAIVTSGPVQDALLKFILMVIHSFSGFIK
jgi:hypothetical protein